MTEGNKLVLRAGGGSSDLLIEGDLPWNGDDMRPLPSAAAQESVLDSGPGACGTDVHGLADGRPASS
jgi:hypothetical protein